MNLIDTRKKMSRHKGDGELYDSHHIIPKCMGGSNSTSNKVLLTPREHFIAHLLLSKSVESQYVKKMYCALVRFMGKNSDRSRIKINSKIYQSIIENNRLHSMGKNNSFYGKTHTEETKKLISIKNKEYNLLNKNSFYGKKHTEETKKILSLKKCKPIKVYFTDNTSIFFSQHKYLGTYLGKSEHLGCKLCRPQFEYLLKNYNILRIERV
jgi:hypothetical protein